MLRSRWLGVFGTSSCPNRSHLTARRIVNFVRVWIQNHFHDFEELGCYDLLNSFIGLLQVTGMSKASENLRSILHRKVRCMRLRDRCLNVPLVQNEEFKAMRADLGKTPDNVALKKDRTPSTYAFTMMGCVSYATSTVCPGRVGPCSGARTPQRMTHRGSRPFCCGTRRRSPSSSASLTLILCECVDAHLRRRE